MVVCVPSVSAIVFAAVEEDYSSQIRRALLTGDNRLKQGVDLAKVRESYEHALELARLGGLEDRVRPLVDVRLADLERLAAEPPPPSPPEA
jgi:hypothetical protein